MGSIIQVIRSRMWREKSNTVSAYGSNHTVDIQKQTLNHSWKTFLSTMLLEISSSFSHLCDKTFKMKMRFTRRGFPVEKGINEIFWARYFRQCDVYTYGAFIFITSKTYNPWFFLCVFDFVACFCLLVCLFVCLFFQVGMGGIIGLFQKLDTYPLKKTLE